MRAPVAERPPRGTIAGLVGVDKGAPIEQGLHHAHIGNHLTPCQQKFSAGVSHAPWKRHAWLELPSNVGDREKLHVANGKSLLV